MHQSALLSGVQTQCSFAGAWGGGHAPKAFYVSSYFWDRAVEAGKSCMAMLSVLNSAVLCCAKPKHVALCCAMPCCAAPCQTVLCSCAVPGCAVLCCIVPCYGSQHLQMVMACCKSHSICLHLYSPKVKVDKPCFCSSHSIGAMSGCCLASEKLLWDGSCELAKCSCFETVDTMCATHHTACNV